MITDNITWNNYVAYWLNIARLNNQIQHDVTDPKKERFLLWDDPKILTKMEKVHYSGFPAFLLNDMELSIDATNSGNVMDIAHCSFSILFGTIPDSLQTQNEVKNVCLNTAKQIISRVLHDKKAAINNQSDKSIAKYVDLSSFEIKPSKIRFQHSLGWDVTFKLGAASMIVQGYDSGDFDISLR